MALGVAFSQPARAPFFFLFAGEVLDLDLTPTKIVFLKHQRNSFIKVGINETKATGHLTRKLLGSIRRSRMTPPLKSRHSLRGRALLVCLLFLDWICLFAVLDCLFTLLFRGLSVYCFHCLLFVCLLLFIVSVIFFFFKGADIKVSTPEADDREEITIAKAWSKSKREGNLAGETLHLPSDLKTSSLTPSHSTSSLLSLKGLLADSSLENPSEDDLIERLHHETNIFVQADFLNYLYSTQ